MASGVVLQMDQTTSSAARLLWPKRERGAHAGLVGYLCLPDGGNRQETAGNPEKSQRNPTDCERQYI